MGKLTNLTVEFLSLVKTPATGKGLTLKSLDKSQSQHEKVITLTKTNDEQMIAYGIVYAPDQKDLQGHYADAATIRKAAYEFLRESKTNNVDLEHSFSPEVAYVAESWLVRKGDALFPDEPVGAWAVGIQVGDVDVWKQLKSGELTGISLAGFARNEPQTGDEAHTTFKSKDHDEPPSWFSRFIKGFTAGEREHQITKETEMNADDVREIIREEMQKGFEPQKDAGGADQDKADKGAGGPSIEEQIAKGFQSLEAKIDEKIDTKLAKSLAKGDLETHGDKGAGVEEGAYL